jgi:hypothetical protein
VQIRVDVVQSDPSMAELRTVVDRSNAIQEALWQHAKAIVAKDNSMVPTGLFIQTLNEMIDDQEKRLAAFRNRVPNVVLLGLFGIAAIAGGFAGYASGLDPKRNRLPVYIMGFLVSAVILLIFDLDRPGSGFIRNDQQSMIDVAANKTLVERLVTSGHVIIDAIHRNRAMDLHRLSRCCALTPSAL